MTSIDQTQFVITDEDPAIVRAAKRGSLDGIAHAEQVHAEQLAAGTVTSFPTFLQAAAEASPAGAALSDHEAEVYGTGFVNWGTLRWWELTDLR